MRIVARMTLMVTWFFAVVPSFVWGGETMVFSSEAKKMEFIRKNMLKEKHHRLDTSVGVSKCEEIKCEEMMNDFLAGKYFRAIEPKVRANSIDDPKLEKWKQCDHGGKGNYGGLKYLGGPPYRYYQVELDNNTKNGPEDVIYYEYVHNSEKYFGIQTGYDWVDLKECEVMATFQVSTAGLPEPDQMLLNALVYYKKEFWVMDYISGFEFTLTTCIDKERRRACSWALFQE